MIGEERIPKKLLYTKREGKRPTNKWMDQIRKDIEMRRKK